MHNLMYWIGAACAVATSLAALAGAFWLVGGLLINAGDRMLRSGLRIVHIANWRYWSARMNHEGITIMPRFYAEEVRKRNPRTPQQYEETAAIAEKKELP